MQNSSSKTDKLIAVLEETRNFLARPGNDFTWSSWQDASHALREMDDLIARLRQGERPPRSNLTVLFLATGPIQEVSISSGWGKDFIALARRFDSAMRRVYGRDPMELALHKAELRAQTHQLIGGSIRWFCSVLSLVAIGFAVYIHYSGEPVEIYCPFHIQGAGAGVFYIMIVSATIFGVLAVINWVSWFRVKRALKQGNFPPPASRPQ